jgi:hypothetical protein
MSSLFLEPSKSLSVVHESLLLTYKGTFMG